MNETLKKNLKPNTGENYKPLPVTELYTDIFTMKQVPICQGAVERLASELVAWAVNDDKALRITQFIRFKRMYKKTFYGWVKKYPFLAEAHEVAMEAIGDRREIGGLTNKYKENTVFKTQHRYDKDWWQDEEKRAELKARTQAAANVQRDVKYTIVVDSYKDEKDPQSTGEDNGKDHKEREDVGGDKSRGEKRQVSKQDHQEDQEKAT